MIKTLLFDFSYVLLFPKDINYSGTLNGLYKDLNNKNIEYDFWNYFYLNKELLTIIDSIKLPKNIFTSGSIQKDLELTGLIKPKFANILSTEDLNISKQDPNAYLLVSKILNYKPQDICFVDDDTRNIEASNKTGMQTIKYIDNNQFILEFNKLLL